MNQKILLKIIEFYSLLYTLPSFFVFLGCNTLALILRLMHKIPSDRETWIDNIQVGAGIVLVLEIYLAYRKPRKEKKKLMIGHLTTCLNNKTCKCSREY